MNLAKLINQKPQLTLVSALLVSLHLIWDYVQGGIPQHHILAREDMPGISNWWGLLTIPVLTWIVLTMISKRVGQSSKEAIGAARGFIMALAYGLMMSILWKTGLDQVMQYLIWLPLLLAFAWPVYRAEFLLGFVLGMFVTFGGVLPLGIGLFLVMGAFLIYRGIRQGILWVINRVVGP